MMFIRKQNHSATKIASRDALPVSRRKLQLLVPAIHTKSKTAPSKVTTLTLYAIPIEAVDGVGRTSVHDCPTFNVAVEIEEPQVPLGVTSLPEMK